MNRNRWFFALIGGLVVVGLIVGIRAKQRMAAQQQPPSLALSENMPALPSPAAGQSLTLAQPVPAMPPASSASAPAAASASLPATGGEIGGPIEIQTALANAGFYHGAIDGKIGPQTQQAIKEFQSAHGLTADGKIGSKTWAALKSFLSAQQQPAPSSQPAQ